VEVTGTKLKSDEICDISHFNFRYLNFEVFRKQSLEQKNKNNIMLNKKVYQFGLCVYCRKNKKCN